MSPEHDDPILSKDLLERFRERADRYDRDNEFFAEDFDELREAGYLRAPVPEEFGGPGHELAAVAREQRRLAQYAPSTALALSMHLYWTGSAADRYRAGDRSADWILRDVAAGEVFAAGHGEPGNDLALDDSRTVAEPDGSGGYRFTGRKVFTSLSPVWTRLGVHARDDSDPEHPKLVHAFVDRDDPGVTTEPTWDTLGVRATRSDDTVLDGATAAPGRVVGVQDIGGVPPLYITGIFGWVLPLLGNVYYGIARRALDRAIESSTRRRSLALGGQAQAHKSVLQWNVADAEIKLDAAFAQLEKVTEDWVGGVDHGPLWNKKLFAAKEFATRTAREVVDTALKTIGASGLHRSNEVERLYRDVRSGEFHPPNSESVHDVIGKTALGLL